MRTRKQHPTARLLPPVYPNARILLEETSTGDPIMQTFIDRYIEQGRQQGIEQGVTRGRQEGEAAMLLRLIDRKFAPPRPPERSDAHTHYQCGRQHPAAVFRPHPHRGQSGRYATLICTGDGLRKKRGTFPRSHYSRRVGLGYGSGQP